VTLAVGKSACWKIKMENIDQSEQLKDTHHKPTTSFLNGVFLGAIIGAGAFFLLGTKEGKKSREKLLKKGKKVLVQLEDIVDEMGEKKEELLEKGEAVKEDIQDKAVSLRKQLETQKQNLKKTIHKVNKDLSKLQKGTSKEVARVKKRFFSKKGKNLH